MKNKENMKKVSDFLRKAEGSRFRKECI